MPRRDDATASSLGRLGGVADLVAFAGLIGLLAFGAWQLDSGEPWRPTPPAATTGSQPCDARDEVVWERASGESVDYATMLSRSNPLRACAPSAGILAVTLGGSVAEQIGARAVLVQGHERLLDVELREERSFEISIPGAGELLLAFANHHGGPSEDRTLWVSRPVFTPRAP